MQELSLKDIEPHGFIFQSGTVQEFLWSQYSNR